MPDTSAPVDFTPLLMEDLELLWYDPTDGSGYTYRGPHGLDISGSVLARGAALLLELLETGGAVLVPRPVSRLRARAQATGVFGANTHVAAAETPPDAPALLPAWENLRGMRRPKPPEKAITRVNRRIVKDARLIDAGLIEFPSTGGRRLSAAGRAFALDRRAELDAFVVRGIRPEGDFSPRTLQLATLLAISRTSRTAYRWVASDGALHDARLDELCRTAESGPAREVWFAVGSALRRSTAGFVH